MATFPYTMSQGSIGRFLKHVRDSGVPSKVTVQYLESVGFKSKNDRQLIPIMKGIGFLDSSGSPSDPWKAYRGSGGARALADAIRSGYAELFDVYPDAYRRDEEAITNFVRGHSDYGAKVVGFAVKTFKALCAEAEFVGEEPPQASDGGADVGQESEARAVQVEPATATRQVVTTPHGATVNINIQLTVPASDDGKLYDEFFAAMKRHLLE